MSAAPKTTGAGPLRRLKVIDAGAMIAGPLAATQLADFGAEVIKLELPEIGDSMRHWTPMKDHRSLWWKVIGRNKKLVTLNLSLPEGREIFRKFVATADIVFENFRPGTFERWGLGYDALAKINPRLVLVRVSGFGQTGPYASHGGYGTIAECFSGIPSFTGFPDKPPTLLGFPLADSVAATFATMSALMAIYERDQGGSGIGQVIDVSLYEPLFRLVESQVIGFDQLGIVKQRIGNRLAEDSPRNTYETCDGNWVGISASSQSTFERLAQAVGMPELITDARFRDNASRCTYGDELDAILVAWFKTKTLTEVMALVDKGNVVAGPVLDICGIFQDPHYRARQNIVEVPDDDFGTVRMQSVVPHFSRTPGCVTKSGGGLGKDNDEVYERLGIGADERARLRSLKVI